MNLHIGLDLDYYPLIAPGERFPINDPTLHPRLRQRDPGTFRLPMSL